MEQSDRELVDCARSGDKAAFGRLVTRYQAMVRRIALKMVRHEHLAQELAQETFLQAYLSLDHLLDPDRFGGWLYGIALNVCRSHIRRQKMDFYSLESLLGGTQLDPALLTAGAPNPELVIEERELHRLVLDAVNALSPRNRAATLLFYYEQRTLQEIAALLDVSVPAVKVRLHRSREQLRASLLVLFPEARQTAAYKERKDRMIEVTVADVVREQGGESIYGDVIVAILFDEAGRRMLPIWIGPFEGEMIAVQLAERSVPRPLTFTFVANLLDAAGVTLEAVTISALHETTFYATARIRADGNVQDVDCRPSDAINLALRTGSPIYVAEAVVETAGVDISAEEALPAGRGLQAMQQRWEQGQREHEEKQRAAAEPSYEERCQRLVAHVLGKQA